MTRVPAVHPHLSPWDLAVHLEESDEDELRELEDRVASCESCLESLETLVYWVDAVGHWDPLVGQEFVTRHYWMAELFRSHSLHRQRLDRARVDHDFHQWGLGHLLLDESRRASHHSAPGALQLAELTQVIVEHLDGRVYGPQWVEDLRAGAAANLAVLEWHRDHLDSSSSLLRLARECVAAGTGREEISRVVEDAGSLFSGDRGPQGALHGPRRDTPSQALAAEEWYLPGPAHQLLERCKAARRDR